MKKTTMAVTAAAMLLATYVSAQTSPPPAADNARSNQVDASNATNTADSQSNRPADIDLTKRVRQSLLADKTLSTYAHNIKVISVDGNVTLNGVVRSEEEKVVIDKKAGDVAGVNNVIDKLKVASK